MASPEELSFLDELEIACGVAQEFRLARQLDNARAGKDRRPSLDVDDVLNHAVDTFRLALKRHATRARLARDLNTLRPSGMGGKPRSTDLAGKELEMHLSGLFLAWFGLATSRKAPDAKAQRLWDNHIAPHLSAALQVGPDERESVQARKRRQAANEKLIAPGVVWWQTRDRSLLAADWHQAWQGADTELQPLLAGLRDRIRPGAVRMDSREHRVSLRRTGGLSLTRLAALRSFYQVQKAFAGRERWLAAQNQWGHTPVKEQFGQRTLNAIERLREQRVKQLASRIAAAALGLAPAAPTPNERDGQDRQAIRLARQRLAKLEPRFVPCHAVVIESLTNYRPDQLQTRRENRQLMQWSSSKVQKYLREACELHGIHLREIPPAYTSRQDSRTGAPGLRCRDVALSDFLRPGGFWEREVNHLKEKRRKGELLKLRQQLIISTFDHWQRDGGSQNRNRAIRLLQDGGELFVSAAASSPAANGVQADLNAAANIGLKALLDPDWEAAWWLVPCARDSHIPKPDTIKGSPLFNDVAQLGAPSVPAGRPAKKQREIVNLWRDVSAAGLATGNWQESTAYWSDVEHRVVTVLRAHNGLPPEDDVPM
jgi:IS605 OrfB family transposase